MRFAKGLAGYWQGFARGSGPGNTLPNPCQKEARTAKRPKKNIDPTKKREELNSPAPFCAKKLPTWPQLGSQVGAKMEKNSMQKSIKNLMHLGIDFRKNVDGFWEAKWSQVGTKIDQKSMPIAKSVKSKKV